MDLPPTVTTDGLVDVVDEGVVDDELAEDAEALEAPDTALSSRPVR